MCWKCPGHQKPTRCGASNLIFSIVGRAGFFFLGEDCFSGVYIKSNWHHRTLWVKLTSNWQRANTLTDSCSAYRLARRRKNVHTKRLILTAVASHQVIDSVSGIF